MLIKILTVSVIVILGSFALFGCDIIEEILVEFTVDNEKLATPALLEELSIKKELHEYTYKFDIDYSGKYELYLLLKTNERFAAGNNYNPDFQMQLNGKVNIIDEKGEILKTEVFAWNFGYGFEGMTVLIFKSPAEVPKKKSVYCEIEYLEFDKNFYERYDSIKIIIKRLGSFLD